MIPKVPIQKWRLANALEYNFVLNNSWNQIQYNHSKSEESIPS